MVESAAGWSSPVSVPELGSFEEINSDSRGNLHALVYSDASGSDTLDYVTFSPVNHTDSTGHTPKETYENSRVQYREWLDAGLIFDISREESLFLLILPLYS